jgi:hypothetical protein
MKRTAAKMKINKEFIKLNTSNGDVYVKIDQISSVTHTILGFYVEMINGTSISCRVDSDDLSEFLFVE